MPHALPDAVRTNGVKALKARNSQRHKMVKPLRTEKATQMSTDLHADVSAVAHYHKHPTDDATSTLCMFSLSTAQTCPRVKQPGNSFRSTGAILPFPKQPPTTLTGPGWNRPERVPIKLRNLNSPDFP